MTPRRTRVRNVAHTLYTCTEGTLYMYTRSVNRAEISRPARKILFWPGGARPGPQSMYYKICTVNFFEILQQNQYNYINLHSHFPLVQKLYCSSTTVMYNVHFYQQRLKNFSSSGGTSNKMSYMNSTQVLYCNGIAKILVRGKTFSKNVLIKDFLKF